MPRHPDHSLPLAPAEPETPSRIALSAWFEADEDRTQVRFGKACGIKQQHVSAILARRSRPVGVLAEAIEAATMGEVPAEGWLTPEERRARMDRVVAAARAGVVMASGHGRPAS